MRSANSRRAGEVEHPGIVLAGHATAGAGKYAK